MRTLKQYFWQVLITLEEGAKLNPIRLCLVCVLLGVILSDHELHEPLMWYIHEYHYSHI